MSDPPKRKSSGEHPAVRELQKKNEEELPKVIEEVDAVIDRIDHLKEKVRSSPPIPREDPDEDEPPSEETVKVPAAVKLPKKLEP